MPPPCCSRSTDQPRTVRTPIRSPGQKEHWRCPPDRLCKQWRLTESSDRRHTHCSQQIQARKRSCLLDTSSALTGHWWCCSLHQHSGRPWSLRQRSTDQGNKKSTTLPCCSRSTAQLHTARTPIRSPCQQKHWRCPPDRPHMQWRLTASSAQHRTGRTSACPQLERTDRQRTARSRPCCW